MIVDIRQYDFIQKRAKFEVYKKYRINKMELWLLTCLEWYLLYRNKTIVSKQDFIHTITGNAREQAKMKGYYQGLVTGKYIILFEYIRKPGSESVGLSDLGIAVLREYDKAIAMFIEKFKKSERETPDEQHYIRKSA